MRIVKLVQGSPEWHAHRAQHFNASDAPAMMSCSPYKTRAELVRELATGIRQEFGPEQQAILDSGHVFERLARPLAEKIVGEDLYPVVGVQGPYSASLDGLTMLEETAFEHKRLNARLREAMFDGCTGTDLPLEYQVQMEHQCMVSTATERVLFMASEWTQNRETGEWVLVEERHCCYTPNPKLRAEIVAGWGLLEKDVAAYDPTSEAKAERPAPKLQQALPALRIDARGEITASNLDEFQTIAMARLNSINMVLETDQHFADADADAKWLRDVAAGMKAAAKRVRAGMESVDAVLNVLEHLEKLSSQKACDLEKKVKAEKDSRKDKIILAAERDLMEHINELNQQMGASYITLPRGIFAPVTKSLKSLQSMEDKVRAALATAQAEATAQAHLMLLNRDFLRSESRDWITLFPDFVSVGKKEHEDFRALAALRIGEHQRAEAERLEKERECIRREEQERADREAREKLEAQANQAQAEITQAGQQGQIAAPLATDLSGLVAERHAEGVAALDANQAIGAAQASAAAADSGAQITLGQLNARLSPISITAAGLAELGFEPCATAKAAKLYRESDFVAICRAIAGHAMKVAQPVHA